MPEISTFVPRLMTFVLRTRHVHDHHTTPHPHVHRDTQGVFPRVLTQPAYKLLLEKVPKKGPLASPSFLAYNYIFAGDFPRETTPFSCPQRVNLYSELLPMHMPLLLLCWSVHSCCLAERRLQEPVARCYLWLHGLWGWKEHCSMHHPLSWWDLLVMAPLGCIQG